MQEPTAVADVPPSVDAPDGLPIPRRYWSLVAILLAMTMAVLDGSIVNVALPTMARDLHTTAGASIWIINAYQLAVTVTLLPISTLGDKLGYRRVYLAGLVVFTLGSLGCALSHTLTELTAARVVQGVGAGSILSITTALVRFTYPRRLLGYAIGLNAMVLSVAAAAGPSVAAIILGRASWEWLFAVNVPLGVVTVAFGAWALPRTIGTGRKFDWLSAALNALALGFLVIGAEAMARVGLGAGAPMLAVGVVAGIVLVYRELRIAAPLVPVDLLRLPVFSLSIVTAIISFIAQMLVLVGLPFYLQDVLGRSAVETGFLMTPMPLALAVGAPLGGRFADRYPAGILGACGLAVFAVGVGALALLPAYPSDFAIVWPLVLCGLGFGFFQAPNNREMISAAPMHRSGAAGGMLGIARLLGQTSGAIGMVLFFRLAGVHATKASLVTATGLALLSGVLSISRLGIPRRPA